MIDKYGAQIAQVNKGADINKLKNLVKKDLTQRLTGIVAGCEVDEYWLADRLSTETVEGLGKLPKNSLKYLEQDLIYAITSQCMNEISNMHYSLMLPSTSEGRFLTLYLFVSENVSNIRYRIRAAYDTSKVKNAVVSSIITNNEIARASENIKSVKVSDDNIKKQYIEFIKALGLDKRPTVEKIINSLIKASYDEYKKKALHEILYYNNLGIAFITCEKDEWDIKRYTIGILAGGFDETKYRNGTEKPCKEWQIYSRLYIIQFIQRQLDKSIGFVQSDVFTYTEFITAHLCETERIAKYGNITKSFEAYKLEVNNEIKRMIHNYGLGKVKIYDKRYYNRFIDKMF